MSGQQTTWRGRAAAAVIAVLAAGPAHASDPSTLRADVVLQALSLLGTPYRYGGSSPSSGLDCSGLVRHVFASVMNRELPRRSEEISAVGHPVTRAELQPGDLVFFNTLRRAFSHVAIYIGDGRFVHAPARAGRVRVEGLDDRYWASRFDGARRVIHFDAATASAEGRTVAIPPDRDLPAPLPGGFQTDRPPGP